MDDIINNEDLPSLNEICEWYEVSSWFIEEIKEAYKRTNPTERKLREEILFVLDYINGVRPNNHEETVKYSSTIKKLENSWILPNLEEQIRRDNERQKQATQQAKDIVLDKKHGIASILQWNKRR